MGRFGAVLWDLDGTLLDTRKDIATGVNLVLTDRGLPALSIDAIARNVGKGSRVLMTRCLSEAGAAPTEATEIERAYEEFLIRYGEHLLDSTRPCDGIPELLENLLRAGVKMAVVSNKPPDPSRRIIEGLELTRYFSVILGGDSLPVRKPHPGPLLRAIDELGVETGKTVMVGDSTIDIEAARAAEIAVAAVTWGFGSRESLLAASPDLLAENPAVLGIWILG